MRKIKSFIYAILAVALLPVVQSCGSSESSSSSLFDNVELIPVQTSRDGKWSMINSKGEIVYEDEFDERPTAALNGLFSVREGKGYSVYRIGGKSPELVEGLENLKDVGALADGLMPVTFPGKRISVVDKNGKTKFELKPVDGVEIVECAPFFMDGMLWFRTAEGKYGYINTDGKVVIKPIYGGADCFYGGIAAVSDKHDEFNDGSNWFLIDKKGEKVSGSKFDDCYMVNYEFGYWAAKRGGRWYIIDKHGNETRLPSKISEIKESDGKYIIFADDNYDYGIANVDGEILTSTKFNEIQFGNNDIFLARKYSYDRSYIQIDAEGEETGKEIDYDYLIPLWQFGYMAEDGDTWVLLDNNFKKKNKYEIYRIGYQVCGKEYVISDYQAYDNVLWDEDNDVEEVGSQDKVTELIIIPDDQVTYPRKDQASLQEYDKVASGQDIENNSTNIIDGKVIDVTPVEAPTPPPSKEDDNKVFETVEQMPRYSGGEAAMMKFISDNLCYPPIAWENGIQGRVTVMFVVTKNGSVGQVKVARGKDPELDKEAVRVVKLLKGFTPGMMNGQPVNVWYTLPITFRLQQ